MFSRDPSADTEPEKRNRRSNFAVHIGDTHAPSPAIDCDAFEGESRVSHAASSRDEDSASRIEETVSSLSSPPVPKLRVRSRMHMI